MESGGREQNYWPGFVDALSNVVLTLVFVLVVFVFALVMTSSQVQKAANELVQAAQEESLKTDAAELKKELAEAKREIQKLKNGESAPIESDAQADIQRNGGIVIKVGVSTVKVIFPPAISGLSEKNAADLDKALATVMPKDQAFQIELRSVVGREAHSIAQRLAYYRAMTLRNYLLKQNLGADVAISSQIVPSTQTEDGYVEIIFHK